MEGVWPQRTGARVESASSWEGIRMGSAGLQAVRDARSRAAGIEHPKKSVLTCAKHGLGCPICVIRIASTNVLSRAKSTAKSKALWRSWLARRPVTAEVAGSSPVRVADIPFGDCSAR